MKRQGVGCCFTIDRVLKLGRDNGNKRGVRTWYTRSGADARPSASPASRRLLSSSSFPGSGPLSYPHVSLNRLRAIPTSSSQAVSAPASSLSTSSLYPDVVTGVRASNSRQGMFPILPRTRIASPPHRNPENPNNSSCPSPLISIEYSYSERPSLGSHVRLDGQGASQPSGPPDSQSSLLPCYHPCHPATVLSRLPRNTQLPASVEMIPTHARRLPPPLAPLPERQAWADIPKHTQAS